MGQSNSTPTASRTFYPETPLQFSHDLVESLQTSSASNASRSTSLDAELERRVQEELKALESKESEALSQALELASKSDSTGEVDTPGREDIVKRLDALQKKLEGRVGFGGVVASEARSEVLRCLVEKDRRPLECKGAVERWKEEVRRLEKEWADKML